MVGNKANRLGPLETTSGLSYYVRQGARLLLAAGLTATVYGLAHEAIMDTSASHKSQYEQTLAHNQIGTGELLLESGAVAVIGSMLLRRQEDQFVQPVSEVIASAGTPPPEF